MSNDVRRQGASILFFLVVWCGAVTLIYTTNMNTSLMKLEENARLSKTSEELKTCKESNAALQVKTDVELNMCKESNVKLQNDRETLERTHAEASERLKSECNEKESTIKGECDTRIAMIEENKKKAADRHQESYNRYRSHLKDSAVLHYNKLNFMLNLSEEYINAINIAATNISEQVNRMGFKCKFDVPNNPMGDKINQIVIYTPTNMVCDVAFQIRKLSNDLKQTSLDFDVKLEVYRQQLEVESDFDKTSLYKGGLTEGDTNDGDTTEGDMNEGDTTEGGTTNGDTTEGGTTEGGTAESGIAKTDNVQTTSGYLPAIFNNQILLPIAMTGVMVVGAMAVPKNWRGVFTFVRSKKFGARTLQTKFGARTPQNKRSGWHTQQ